MNVGRRRGFSLIEALVSIVLLGVGITAVAGGLGALAQSNSRLERSTQMFQLGTSKLDEIIATGESRQGNPSGDFAAEGYPEYRWETQILPSGVENLNVVRLTVALTRGEGPTVEVSTLEFVDPEAQATP